MRALTLLLAAGLAATALPTTALACGGLFCNTAQPVNQAAERILFARNGDRVEMHVRLTWAGPPTEFGWLLPVPTDVEVGLSSEQLFTVLDSLYAPLFTLQTVFDDGCDNFGRGGVANADAGAFAPGEGDPSGGGGGVQILSREAVGPFDTVVLQADNVRVLRAWLDDNDYGIPDGSDDLLQPYIDAGAAFVALRLLPNAQSTEVQPIKLTFGGAMRTVPIRPTQVAAEPDMGVIVHVLGDARAIPTNYLHVRINEAAIDWPNNGQNYPDVVSQAADEAGGQAFATDYAGTSGGLRGSLRLYEGAELERIRATRTGQELQDIVFNFQGDSDLARILPGVIEGPEGFDPQDYFQCPFCYEGNELTVDGAELARQIEEDINPPRRGLLDLVEAHPYLTRLYTTLSSDEMTVDPIFDENPDLDAVSNQWNATQYIHCGMNGEPDFEHTTVETASGLRFPLLGGQNPDVIQREAGETVRGEGIPAARVIEQHLTAGQPMVAQDRSTEIADRYAGDAGGCSCDVGEGGTPMGLLGLLGLVAMTRRRRR